MERTSALKGLEVKAWVPVLYIHRYTYTQIQIYLSSTYLSIHLPTFYHSCHICLFIYMFSIYPYIIIYLSPTICLYLPIYHLSNYHLVIHPSIFLFIHLSSHHLMISGLVGYLSIYPSTHYLLPPLSPALFLSLPCHSPLSLSQNTEMKRIREQREAHTETWKKTEMNREKLTQMERV